MGQRLGDLLIERGLLTPSQLKTALRTQEFFGGHLGSILIELGFLDERTLGETLARSAGVRYAPSDLLVDIPEEVIRAVPAKVAERHKAVPIRIQDKRLHLAMLNPRDLLSLDEVAYLTGMIVVPYVAPEYRIYEALERYYHLGRLRPERINVTGKVDPQDLVHEEAQSAASGTPSRGSRPSPHGSVGLDGLPLDAEVDLAGASFAGAAPPPRTEQILDQLPRSLSEWREGAGTQDLPVAAPPLPASPPLRPARREPAPVSAAAAPAPVAAPSRDPLHETAQRLLAAETREDIAEILLNATGRFFRRRLLFVVQKDRIVGWDGWGDQVAREKVKNVLLPVESLSLFTPVRSSATPFRGPVADLPANRRLFEDLGMKPPPEMALLPLLIKDRVVAVLYGDNGSAPLSILDMEQLRRQTLQAAMALEILILRTKILSV
jgi:hypothetical protein